MGAPWIQNNLIKERKGASVSLHCQVWTKFNSEAAQGMFTLDKLQVYLGGISPTIDINSGIHWTFNGKTIHTLPENPDHIGIEAQGQNGSSLAGVHFVDEFSRIGLGITTTMNIDSFDRKYEGNYSCQNGIVSGKVENKVTT